MASIPSLLVATGASILDIDISSNQSQYIVNGSVKNLPYDMTGVFQKKASTLSQASGTGGFVSSTTYTSCESIYEAGKSVGSGSYYIRNSSGALTQMGCVMNY